MTEKKRYKKIQSQKYRKKNNKIKVKSKSIKKKKKTVGIKM